MTIRHQKSDRDLISEFPQPTSASAGGSRTYLCRRRPSGRLWQLLLPLLLMPHGMVAAPAALSAVFSDWNVHGKHSRTLESGNATQGLIKMWTQYFVRARCMRLFAYDGTLLHWFPPSRRCQLRHNA